MNAPSRDNNRTLMLTLLAGMTVVILLLAGFLSIAGAQTDPDKPPFAGVLLEVEPGQELNLVTPLNTDVLGPEWRPIFREDFESPNWEVKWDVNLDFSAAGYKWGTRSVPNSLDPQSTAVAWAIGGGPNGSGLDPLAPSYPVGVNSWLVAGPLDLSGAKDALIDLDLFYEASGGDPFTVAVSEDRFQFTPQFTVNEDVNKGNGQWAQKTVSLASFIGKPQIWIAFTFESGNSASKLGALMDNVSVWMEGEPGTYLPMISYDLVPTSVPPTVEPPPGGGPYEKNFTDNIDGWLDRRATFGTQFSLSHDPAADSGYSGFLNLLVNTAGSHYVIASPLVAGKAPPYNIETVVKMRSPREDGDQYGVVFGGNYDPSAGECRAEANGTCFTQYYEMRVYYFHDDAANKDRMNMKLKRIDGVDANNNSVGEDLIDWTRVSDVEENDFIEWDITVEADGKIKISANENPVDSATDSTYINNPYFGVIVRTEDHSDSEAKFDYFKLD